MSGMEDRSCTCDVCSGEEDPQTGHCTSCRKVINFSEALNKEGEFFEPLEGDAEPFCSEECVIRFNTPQGT